MQKSQPPPSLSVVVCTLNRCSQLKRCVDALLSVSTDHAWEIVIVDNGSTDSTSDYLALIDQQYFGRVKVTATLEPKRGLSVARNKGWQTAKGEIISFTDDDCYVSKDYVDSIIKVFHDSSNIGFSAGRILLFDPLDYRITIYESKNRRDFPPLTFIAAGELQGANMAFKKNVLERIGGFDENLGAGTPFPAEDIDAAAAALWAGFAGVFDPGPVVYHHHGRRTDREAQDLMRGYDAGRGAYYMKYIFRKDSRYVYIRAWIRSIRNDWGQAFKNYAGALLRGKIPQPTLFRWRSIRELYSGMRFAIRCALENGNSP